VAEFAVAISGYRALRGLAASIIVISENMKARNRSGELNRVQSLAAERGPTRNAE
jgi:hypothetical protein